MTNNDGSKFPRPSFDRLEQSGFLPPVDLKVLDRSDDDVLVGMSRKSKLTARNGLKFTRPMSRRGLLHLSK